MDPGQRPEPELATGNRSWLDGLRAIAVLMVVVQHVMGQLPVDLGFVGVGVFFALSGYLITSLLLDEQLRRGTVSLSRFYIRRLARLAPALIVVVLVCDLLFLTQHDFRPVWGSLAALTYTSNYVQIVKPDAVPGFGPTWSLAIEEHFYLLWPLVLLAITRRFGLRTALRATLAVCLVALAWRAGLAALGAPHLLLSIGSLERADALLYGCAAAIALRVGWRPRAWMFWVGAVGVTAMPVFFNHENYWVLVLGSAALALAAAVVVVGLDYTAPTWLQRALSLRPVVTLGVLSYGIYLWHGPLMRIAADMGYSGRGWRAAVAVLTVLVAATSYRYIEAPIRARVRRRPERSMLTLRLDQDRRADPHYSG